MVHANQNESDRKVFSNARLIAIQLFSSTIFRIKVSAPFN
jgi:hypothetical protein